MAYPSVLSALSNPNATDRLNSPSHSSLHQSENSAITQVETFLGLEGSASTVGTLIYDVRSPASNGGGHVQTANKGGTGQVTFNKGDTLVAQSSSVISKLSVGSMGDFVFALRSVSMQGLGELKYFTSPNIKAKFPKSFKSLFDLLLSTAKS